MFVLTFLMFPFGMLRAQDPDTCQITTSMRQLRLTCSNSDTDNGRTAQVKVNVSNGVAPYTYYWEEGFGVEGGLCGYCFEGQMFYLGYFSGDFDDVGAFVTFSAVGYRCEVGRICFE